MLSFWALTLVPFSRNIKQMFPAIQTNKALVLIKQFPELLLVTLMCYKSAFRILACCFITTVCSFIHSWCMTHLVTYYLVVEMYGLDFRQLVRSISSPRHPCSTFSLGRCFHRPFAEGLSTHPRHTVGQVQMSITELNSRGL